MAITANPFDAKGLDPAFYVNVQYGGDNEVVHLAAGVTSDQMLYYYTQPDQPVVHIARSNVLPSNETVLTRSQLFQLGTALAALHERSSAAYGPASGKSGWYAIDVEFKFDNATDQAKSAALYIKQARPYAKVTPP